MSGSSWIDLWRSTPHSSSRLSIHLLKVMAVHGKKSGSHRPSLKAGVKVERALGTLARWLTTHSHPLCPGVKSPKICCQPRIGQGNRVPATTLSYSQTGALAEMHILGDLGVEFVAALDDDGMAHNEVASA